MKKYLLDRELSWLNFNKRVLDLSQSKDISLKDRLFLYSIAHSNLDEFFQIRISGLIEQVEIGELSGFTDKILIDEFNSIFDSARKYMQNRVDVWNDRLKEELSEFDLSIKTMDQLTKSEKIRLKDYFINNVMPSLTPLASDQTKPFPYISDLSLSIGVFLKKNKRKGDKNAKRGTTRKYKKTQKGGDDVSRNAVALGDDDSSEIKLQDIDKADKPGIYVLWIRHCHGCHNVRVKGIPKFNPSREPLCTNTGVAESYVYGTKMAGLLNSYKNNWNLPSSIKELSLHASTLPRAMETMILVAKGFQEITDKKGLSIRKNKITRVDYVQEKTNKLEVPGRTKGSWNVTNAKKSQIHAKFLNKNFKNIDLICHCASLIDSAAYSEIEYKNTNILGTENIYSVAQKENIKKIVLTSSTSVMEMDKKNEKWPIYEKYVGEPNNIYGKSKKEQELIAKKYSENYNIQTICLRPCSFFNLDNPELGFRLTGSHAILDDIVDAHISCLLYTSPSPRDLSTSRMPSSA